MAHNKYSLYYTLNVSLPDKKMDSKTKNALYKKLLSLDRLQTEAVFLLIVEHYRIAESSEINLSNFTLPYGGIESNGDITFDINRIPDELLRILHKFLDTE